MMEYLFEFLLKLLFEESDKRVFKVIRYPLIVLLILFFSFVIFILFFFGVVSFQNHVFLGMFLLFVALFFLFRGWKKFKCVYLKQKK